LVKTYDSGKKTDNKKTDNKKTDNKKTIVVVVILSLVLFSILFVTFGIVDDPLSDTSTIMSDYIENLSVTHTIQAFSGVPFFDFYVTASGVTDANNNVTPADGVRVTLNPQTPAGVISSLEPNEGTVVIYPIFTSAAYQDGGFYDYYAGDCDESCVTDIPFDTPRFLYTSSGLESQILYHLGYPFLTDIDVDQNPKLLQNYDTVILLHNEYATKKMFDAITGHPNLIFLAPNALYAEIEVDYDKNTMTLIHGHNYPEFEIYNGFDYAVEEKFHDYEYDAECLEWKFIEIENGFHLNCYPGSILHKNLDILLKLKELT
jgi:hypothetical protein